MLDTCHLLAYSTTADDFGEMVPFWTEMETNIACGLEQGQGSERTRGDMTTLTWDATMRLPIDTELDVRDRLKVTKRFGVDITPIEYGIVGPIQRGPSGIRLRLQVVDV